ncbi:hypothetical protein BZA77DRAFT_163578 [Pyronema omphalodes]|nr:hypothetical protein BZA77DRAFT_163578 [Pyronema omphalodes]
MQILSIFSLAITGFSAISSAAPYWQPKTAHELGDGASGCPLDKAVLPMVNEPGMKELSKPSKPYPVRVVIGRGTQNYTCASSSESDAPVATGAKAHLYDASCLAQYAPEILHSLPSALLDIDNKKTARFIQKKAGMWAGENTDINVGVHMFNAQKTPVFNYAKQKPNDIFYGKKNEGVKAPSKANKGKYGAVDWLLLGAVKTGEVKYSAAYRVVTAGGSAPPTCKGMKKHFEIPYATEYWFYD